MSKTVGGHKRIVVQYGFTVFNNKLFANVLQRKQPMHHKQYFVVLLVKSHLHVADPAFEIWQYKKNNDLF